MTENAPTTGTTDGADYTSGQDSFTIMNFEGRAPPRFTTPHHLMRTGGSANPGPPDDGGNLVVVTRPPFSCPREANQPHHNGWEHNHATARQGHLFAQSGMQFLQ